MARYLLKYKGVYRVRAHLDQFTNDFPRLMETGQIDPTFDDLYIKCEKGAQIYHYGRSILIAYIPSVIRGHNILKSIAAEILGDIDEFSTMINNGLQIKWNYDGVYAKLSEEGTVYDIMENDEEIEFKFNAKYLDWISSYLKPQTSGANISPFSTRNLPKGTYTIPIEELAVYKEMTSLIPKQDILIISQITKRFLSKKLSKNKLYKTIDIKLDMRKKMIKGKEYIHSMGAWDDYLEYLKEELKRIAGNYHVK
jgi:hypothetical protein